MLAGGTFEEWFSFNCNEAVKYLDAVEEGDKETLDVAQHLVWPSTGAGSKQIITLHTVTI